MSRTVPVVLGFALAGLVGALVALFVFDGGEPPPTTIAARADPDPRVDELLRTVSVLRDRVEALELRPAPSAASASARPGDASPDGADPVAAVPGAVDDAVDAKIRAVVEETQREQGSAMGRMFAGRAAARESAVLDGLANDHGLTPYQREEMEKLLARRREAVSAFMRTRFGGATAEGSPSPEELRKKMEDVAAETDEALKTLLSPDQYETFKAEDPQQRMGPLGAGRGPRPEGR